MYQIENISHYAENLLNVPSGVVHSVYRKTINLSAGGRLLALQAKESPLSPISLITSLSPERMEALHIKKGDCVSFLPGALTIQADEKPYTFSYHNAIRQNLLLPGELDFQARRRLAANIGDVISRSGKGGFDAIFTGISDEELPLMFRAAKEHITCCTKLYRQTRFAEAAGELSRLLGLGIGLTPSGDDFLCGTLAGIRLQGQNDTPFGQSLRTEIVSRLSDTIDISAAFLACALENQYSLAVNRLRFVPPPEEILADFLAIGHSSGIDTLCGCFYALQLGTG